MSEIGPALVQFFNEIQTQSKKKILCIKSDNGSEFRNSSVQSFMTNNFVKPEYSAPYSPQQNGLAESTVKQIKSGCENLLKQASLANSFWEYAVFCYVFVKNRQFHHGTNSIPFKDFFGQFPNYDRLRVFGANGTYLQLFPM